MPNCERQTKIIGLQLQWDLVRVAEGRDEMSYSGERDRYLPPEAHSQACATRVPRVCVYEDAPGSRARSPWRGWRFAHKADGVRCLVFRREVVVAQESATTWVAKLHR